MGQGGDMWMVAIRVRHDSKGCTREGYFGLRLKFGELFLLLGEALFPAIQLFLFLRVNNYRVAGQ